MIGVWCFGWGKEERNHEGSNTKKEFTRCFSLHLSSSFTDSRSLSRRSCFPLPSSPSILLTTVAFACREGEKELMMQSRNIRVEWVFKLSCFPGIHVPVGKCWSETQNPSTKRFITLNVHEDLCKSTELTCSWSIRYLSLFLSLSRSLLLMMMRRWERLSRSSAIGSLFSPLVPVTVFIWLLAFASPPVFTFNSCGERESVANLMESGGKVSSFQRENDSRWR